MFLTDILADLLGDLGALFRRKPPVDPDFTPRAQQVFAVARQEAGRRCRGRVEITHLLFALVRSEKNAGCDVLRRLGVDPVELARELESLAASGQSQAGGKALSYSNNLKKCLAYAAREATAMNHRYVGTDHLLLGLLRVGENPAPGFFSRHGLSPDRVREDIRAQVNRASQANE